MAWEIVVGIETHAHLLTKSKMFSGASTAFGAEPNTQASAVDIALPGVLPVLNAQAVELAVRFGLAVGGTINRRSVFARKNYFYPDLPKGYQISQYEMPVVQGGALKIATADGEKTIHLTRAHLEEDAGKSIHDDSTSGVVGLGVVGQMIVGKRPSGLSAIDLNRAGIPLLEIVTEPDLRGAKEAVAYAQKLHALLVEYQICDGNMQEGSFRCDANVSVRRVGDTKLGTRCEIKNLNSFRFMEQAIEYEARRQIEVLEDGGTIEQQTRLYDPDKNETRSMRTKEDAHDYRYFPDPDLLPLMISESDIERVRAALPETLEAMRERFVNEFGFTEEMANVLTQDRARALDFQSFWKHLLTLKGDRTNFAEDAVQAANWLMMEVGAMLNRLGISIEQCPIGPQDRAVLVFRVMDGTISRKIAREVFNAMWAGEGDADAIIEKRGLKQISDSGAIGKIVDEVLAANAKQVADYRAGKEKAFNSLVGQVMKRTQGKANPAQVNEILRRKLAG